MNQPSTSTNYSIEAIAKIVSSNSIIRENTIIEHLVIDSRKLVFPESSLFFALHGNRRNGHDFIEEVHERGVRNFVVDGNFNTQLFTDSNFILVDDVLASLQELAAFHRKRFDIPVIGITGSNGKTIVKEWLNQMLSDEYSIVRSPRSYNSQIGVPLSVWEMNEGHTLAIFEAGISTRNEMEALNAIIQPSIGILTNIGEAHAEGFASIQEKIAEKLKLFDGAQYIVYGKDYIPTDLLHNITSAKHFSWSRNGNATVVVNNQIIRQKDTLLEFTYKDIDINFTLSIPFTDAASIENCITCVVVLLLLGYKVDQIESRLGQLQPVLMRMQLIKGNHNCLIVNDSYSNDISSLTIALDYVLQQAGSLQKTVVLSSILQSSTTPSVLYHQVAQLLKQREIERFIGIGSEISSFKSSFEGVVPQTEFYLNTESFLKQLRTSHFKDEIILLKGARSFEFEHITAWMQQKVHQTVLEINLTALVHNLKQYQHHLLPTTKVMAMVKAFGYGSGTTEIARILQFHKIDYLAVAYADEGVELRKAGISVPIMVMNADEMAFDTMIEHSLEPEIYSKNMYFSFHQYLLLQGMNNYPIHLKVNTGMNRLGFNTNEAEWIANLISANSTMTIRTVFSHLAASENPTHDSFTLQQARQFDEFCSIVSATTHHPFHKHLSNSAAIFQHPFLQYDMVRLGIGLYGVDSGGKHQLELQTVATLKTTIAQIRKVEAGETIGYNRNGVVKKDSTIAVIRIGYADGFSRKLGNGNGKVFVNGHFAPTIGNICMDMTMIDITYIPLINEGDEVEVFGKNITVQELASSTDTIPYEILAGISQRVKRVYWEE